MIILLLPIIIIVIIIIIIIIIIITVIIIFCSIGVITYLPFSPSRCYQYAMKIVTVLNF